MNYYQEIENYIQRNEINKRVRVLEENNDILNNYWNIGRLLIEAQGGRERAKYGNQLIKEWSTKYTEQYGKGYDATNLRKFRQFYLCFPKCAPLGRVSWTNIRMLLPIKETNQRNYYLNLCLKNGLSKRELENAIKTKSFERLIHKPEKVEIVSNPYTTSLTNMKNPILIQLRENESIVSEKDLELKILSELKFFFSQLGEGFSLVDNQYKIVVDQHSYFIDLLLFNYNLNCFIVVELKTRSLKKEDKAQVEFYIHGIDQTLKREFHNHTLGIIITKSQNQFIANFVGSEHLFSLTYKIMKSIAER